MWGKKNIKNTKIHKVFKGKTASKSNCVNIFLVLLKFRENLQSSILVCCSFFLFVKSQLEFEATFAFCTPEASPCEARSATSCSALLVCRSTALVISFSLSPLSHHVLQVEACLEPKGYLLFLLKECWLFNLCCCAALALLPSSSSPLLRSYINFPTSTLCLCPVIKWPIAITTHCNSQCRR